MAAASEVAGEEHKEVEARPVERVAVEEVAEAGRAAGEAPVERAEPGVVRTACMRDRSGTKTGRSDPDVFASFCTSMCLGRLPVRRTSFRSSSTRRAERRDCIRSKSWRLPVCCRRSCIRSRIDKLLRSFRTADRFRW